MFSYHTGNLFGSHVHVRYLATARYIYIHHRLKATHTDASSLTDRHMAEPTPVDLFDKALHNGACTSSDSASGHSYHHTNIPVGILAVQIHTQQCTLADGFQFGNRFHWLFPPNIALLITSLILCIFPECQECHPALSRRILHHSQSLQVPNRTLPDSGLPAV